MDSKLDIPASDRSAIHSDDASQLTGYQSPSALAILGLLLGLASPLCVFGKLLIAIPLVGAGVSLLALRRIAASEGELVGRPIAKIGLILSIVCGAAFVTNAAVTRQLRAPQAAEIGRQWIAFILAGNTQGAFQLTSGDPPPDLSQPQEFGPEGNPYDRFLEMPVLKALVSAGKDAVIHDQGTVRYGAQGGGEFYVRRQFTVIPQTGASEDDRRPEPIPVLLQLHRKLFFGESQMVWRVTPIEEVE